MSRRPCRRRVLALLTVAMLVLSLAPALAAPLEEEAAVDDAQARLDAVRSRAAALSSRLDAAAAAYEEANAHHLRLEGERDDVEAAVADAVARADESDRAFRARVGDAYKRPHRDYAVFEAFRDAPDAVTAAHRSALLDQLTAREAGRRAGAHRAAADAAVKAAQHRVIAVGSAAAAEDREREAATLRTELDEAGAAILAAEDGLERAETAAEQARAERERAEREAAAERAAEQTTALSSMTAPVPRADGKVCPIGTPNAFIDSWGYPRSGGRQHQGVDMFAEHGMPLYAVADGVISRVWNNRLGGLSIDLIDDDGDRYYHAHLSAAHVSSGQRVRAGDVIGANGNSGNARTTPPHLHWQYHPGNGPAVNPYPLAKALCR